MADPHRADALLAMGELHTALLRSSAALSVPASERLLSLAGGERVARHERPIAHVVSPLVLTGIDCPAATSSGSRARVVGTVEGRVSITGGHVLQGSTLARVVRSAHARRLGWSHYLARPGQVELIGRADPADLTRGFLARAAHPQALDLGAISARLVGDVQAGGRLDGSLPFRVERTRLRWVALPAVPGEPPAPQFQVERDGLRVLVVHGDVPVEEVAEFASDLALHDWLLSALLRLVERSRVGLDDRQSVIARLRPAVEHLLHLWMPGARGAEASSALWTALDRRPGLHRQWIALVNRVRDQLALGAITALSEYPRSPVT
jgi:hypothetical protein